MEHGRVSRCQGVVSSTPIYVYPMLLFSFGSKPASFPCTTPTTAFPAVKNHAPISERGKKEKNM